jgi:hypothetical protein
MARKGQEIRGVWTMSHINYLREKPSSSGGLSIQASPSLRHSDRSTTSNGIVGQETIETLDLVEQRNKRRLFHYPLPRFHLSEKTSTNRSHKKAIGFGHQISYLERRQFIYKVRPHSYHLKE